MSVCRQLKSVFACSLSPVCDGIWLSHCCRRLKKRAAEKVSRPKVNVSAGGRYTVTGQPTVHLHSIHCSFDSGFPVGSRQ